MPRTKRKDKSRVVLRTGESQRADGTYGERARIPDLKFSLLLKRQ